GRPRLEPPPDTPFPGLLQQFGFPADLERVALVNGTDAPAERLLQPGDVLTVFPPPAGGSRELQPRQALGTGGGPTCQDGAARWNAGSTSLRPRHPGQAWGTWGSLKFRHRKALLIPQSNVPRWGRGGVLPRPGCERAF